MNVRNKIWWLLPLVLWLACAPQAFSQNKKELEDKRKKILKDISVTDKMLKKTTKTKDATFDRFVALQSQIKKRENLIETITAEIAASEESVVRANVVIESLSADIRKMQEEYGHMVRSGFRRKSLSNPLLYILSAESLNQAFRRWLFLRKYDQYRKQQAEAIAFIRDMLAKKKSTLENSRTEKENLLLSMQNQQVTLSSEMLEKDELLKTLSQDEVRLRQDLQKKQKAFDELNRTIERIIQEEITKKSQEDRKAAAAKKEAAALEKKNNAKTNTAPPSRAPDKKPDNSTIAAKPLAEESTADLAGDAFSNKRGQLPWPVNNGFIARGFGRHKHPTLKNIEITNNGVDIRTDEESDAYAVYEGRVAGVQFIPGHDYTIIIQHGDYYTVYSNLSVAHVSKGDNVRAGQSIGQVSSNPITGSSELHFELWRQKERLNPEGWMSK